MAKNKSSINTGLPETPHKKVRLGIVNTNQNSNKKSMDTDSDNGAGPPLCKEESRSSREMTCTENSSEEDLTISNIIHLSGPPVKDVEMLFKRYWESKTKKTLMSEEEIVAGDFHKWSTVNKVLEKSHTLQNILAMGGLENVINCKESVENILKELLLDFKVVNVNTLKSQTTGMAYDIESVPKLSFVGFGATEEVATENAAKKALNFFIKLSQ